MFGLIGNSVRAAITSLRRTYRYNKLRRMINDLRSYCDECGTDFDVALTLDERDLLIETNKSAFRAALLKAKDEGNLLPFLANELGEDGAISACFGMVGRNHNPRTDQTIDDVIGRPVGWGDIEMGEGNHTKNIYDLWPDLAEAKAKRMEQALNYAKENRLCNPHYTWSGGRLSPHYSAVEPEAGTELTPEIAEAIGQLAEKIKAAKAAREEALKSGDLTKEERKEIEDSMKFSGQFKKAIDKPVEAGV